MHLNLTAAWKELAQDLNGNGLSEDDLEMCRKSYYGGANEMLRIQRNISKTYEGEAATILFEALLKEVHSFVCEAREAWEAWEAWKATQ